MTTTLFALPPVIVPPGATRPVAVAPPVAALPVSRLSRPVKRSAKAAASDTSRRLLPALMWLGPVLGVGLLVAELSTSDPAAMLRTLRPGWLVAALACTVLSLLAAAHNLRGFATVRLRTSQTVMVQLAIGFTRTFLPAALTTPAVASRYLNRRGAPWPLAMGSVGAAQLAQLIVTTVIVAGLSLTGTHHLPQRPELVAAVVGGAAVVLGVGVLIARRSAAVRRGLGGVLASWSTLRAHARQNPGRIATGVVAAGVLTATHILAFACCVYAVGGHGTLLALSIVYLGSSAAGSLVPTPGGAGAVEAALVAGLTATGLPLPVAAAAALLSRLDSVWLPAVPGWWALRRLRRDGLL